MGTATRNIMNMVCGISMFFVFFLFASTAQAATIGRPINYVGLTNGLVGHWTFDATDMFPNVRDRSGQGNHGNLIGQTSTTSVGGRLGQALSFDGVNDYINIPAHSSLNVTNYTLSFWLYKNNDLCAASGFRDYVSKDDGNTFYVGEQCASPRRYLGHSPSQEVSVSGKFPVGRWVHVSGTFDTTNNTINFYQDGVLIGSGDTFTTDPPSTDSLTRIGAWSSVVPESFIFGKMDDVRIYNRALSASEIKQLYAMGATKLGLSASPAGSLSSGLVGHWTFDGKDMGPNVRDISGQGNHGDLIGQTATTTAPGVLGQSLQFTTGNRVHYSTIQHGTVHTAATWVYLNSSGQNAILVSNESDFSQLLRIRTLGTELTYINSTGAEVDVAYAPPSRKWWHFAAVRDGTSVSFYVNGSQVGTTQTLANNNTTSSRQLSYSSIPILGRLDDTRIYNRALSASEIKQLYNMGATKLGLSASPAGSLSSGLVGHWTFDGKDMGPNVRDISGQGNHGDLIGQTSTTSVGGRMGQGLDLDGVDDWVSVTDSDSLSISNMNGMTMSVWVKPRDLSAWPTLIEKRDSYEMRIQYSSPTDQGRLDAAVHYSDGTRCRTSTVTQSIFTNKNWYHIVAVATSTSVGMKGCPEIYVNGVLQASAGAPGAASFQDTQAIGIGRRPHTATNQENGVLDDVRVYNRALSASEVQQLYNMGR